MAGDSGTHAEATYSPWIGLIFIFNLIVGTGALTLPAAFANAGWIISLCVILVLGVVSYITLTFVVESMAAANAVLRKQRDKVDTEAEDEKSSTDGSTSESSPPSSPSTRLLQRVKVRRKREQRINYTLLQSGEVAFATTSHDQLVDTAKNEERIKEPSENCDIKETVELGRMAGMFFNKIGLTLFFLCIAIYLYGDLAIYGAAVGKSLRDVSCTYFPPDLDCNVTLNGTDLCWEGTDISRDNAYRLLLVIFVVVIGSFAFFNVQKTLALQIVTSLIRWIAFILMIVLACIRLATYSPEDLGKPSVAILEGVPNLFGACVYSFMCHHSLPSLVTPISPKRNLYKLLISDYVLITGFYLLLAFTGIFAFDTLQDLYTLNFVPDRCGGSSKTFLTAVHLLGFKDYDIGQEILRYFLALFPVFTLSTSFPIIAITLRNNLKQLFLRKSDSHYHWTITRLLFPLLALLPPTIVAVATSDVQFLVGITGSYAGAGVQYIIPACLAFYARRALIEEYGVHGVSNAFASPFKHVAWVIFVLVWAVACIGFVTYNHIATGK